MPKPFFQTAVSAKLLAWALVAAITGIAGAAQAAESSKTDTMKVAATNSPPAAGITFAKEIKPIFDQSCVVCHGQEKPKAKLRLDSLEATLNGGGGGKVIIPGDSSKSLLFIKVARIGSKGGWMPPPRNNNNLQPLTAEQIGLIRTWVDQGAK